MDNEKFLAWLTEVSEWHRPQIGPKGCASVRKGYAELEHPGEVTESELDDMTDDEVRDYYRRLIAWRESQPNMDIPPEIKKLKYQPRPCEDCGRILPEPRLVEHSVYNVPQRHWRERCVNCRCFRHPKSGEFTVTSTMAGSTFGSYYNPNKVKYKKGLGKNITVPNNVREQIWEILHEDENGIVRGPKNNE